MSDAERDFEDVDETALLIEQTALLQAIRRDIGAIREALTDGTNTDRGVVECQECGKTIAKADRKSHGETCFGWHSGLGTELLLEQYEPADN